MDTIRETIDLLEATAPLVLKQVKLPYGEGDLAPVLTKKNIDIHYGKLYHGYVERFNSHEGDRSFNEAGAFLHDIWFSQFKSPGSNRPFGRVLDLIDRHFDNYISFKQEFKTEAMKIQGSGWCYLSKNGKIRTIRNHAKRTDIAVLVDMWEHSYQPDYGSNKNKYLDNIWRIIDWTVVNHRL